jgi:acyl-CoA thioester hydrolase
MGVAYHANYFRWFEIGRTELFRDLGFPYKRMEEEGFFFPVSEANCKYLAPARYDDVLTIETEYDAGFRAGIKFNYLIRRSKDNQPVARGTTLHACLDRRGRVVRPPRFLKELMAEADGQPAGQAE